MSLERSNRFIYQFRSGNSRKAGTAGNAVPHYYQQVNRYYRKLHSADGAMHMPVETNAKETHIEKLQFQANRAAELITENQCAKVLEVGCGMGYNLHHLARLFPSVDFVGLDLSESNLAHARRGATALDNVSWIKYDFNQPLPKAEKYDLILAVETLCYANDLGQTLEHLSAQLNPGGEILIFDAFEDHEKMTQLSVLEKESYSNLLWGWSLQRFHQLEGQGRLQANFDVKEFKNWSRSVLTNFNTYQKGARKVMRLAPVFRLLLWARLLPMGFIQQVSAGLFAHYFVDRGYLRYLELRITPSIVPIESGAALDELVTII